MRDYDESDAKVRASPRGSRPRSKQRPAHEDAVLGMVTGVDRGRVAVRLTDPTRTVTAVKARELGRRALVVGDMAGVVGDTSGAAGTLARVVRREERRTTLRRSADDADPVEKVMVANADQLAIVTSLADPEPNSRMIDRCLIAAYDGGITPLLVLTKADLASDADLRAAYEPLDVTVLHTVVRDSQLEGLKPLMEQLVGRMTVLVGYSGVGKSTLVNALIPSAQRSTGVVNTVTGRGRHTSTSVVALELEHGGWIIDTPGVRSFGLAHVSNDAVVDAFPDVAQAAHEFCPRACHHTSAEDGCELDQWATSADEIARVDSIRRLLASKALSESW